MTDVGNDLPAIRISILMAVGLLAVVSILNLFSGDGITVDWPLFEKHVEEGQVVKIEIAGDFAIAELTAEVTLWRDGNQEIASKVSSRIVGNNWENQVVGWRKRGIEVTRLRFGAWREWRGSLLLMVFLSAGGWYIWKQIQEDRTGIGSPRRRLQELEDEYERGNVDEKKYQELKEQIWAHM